MFRTVRFAICALIFALAAVSSAAAFDDGQVEVKASVFNPGLSGAEIQDVKGYYQNLGAIETFEGLSRYELHRFARETIRIGKLQSWESRAPNKYGCRGQLEDRLNLKCLTKDERSALYDYKDDEEYKDINDALRYDMSLPEGRRASDYQPVVSKIVSSLRRLTPADQITFRGVKWLEPLKDLRKGSEYSDPAFFSTSLSASVGMRFSKGVALMIVKSKSCPFVTGAEDGRLSFEMNELEVLCAPKTKFVVHDVMSIEGIRVLFLVEK